MVTESPNRFQTLQSSDSDTESIAEAVNLFNSYSATLIQAKFCSFRQRNTATPSTMSTDYEFPGGFKVAVNLTKPVVNTDGLSAGSLYKKETRPTDVELSLSEIISVLTGLGL
jgi:hypothetical protein